MAAKLNLRFLRIKKKRLFQNTSKLRFKSKNFQSRAKIDFNTHLITLGASLAIMPSWHEEIVLALRVTSYGVVPGEAKFKKEAGLPN